MIELVGAIFMASLIGSPHCAGMCSGIVALSAGIDQTRARDWRRALLAPLAYNLGRLGTYTALGAIAGAFGNAIDLAGSAAGIQRTAMIVAGTGMIVIGVISLMRAAGFKIGCSRQPQWMQRMMGSAFRAASTHPPMVRAAMLGLLTGFLPCGWLYSFLIVSAGTASAPMGALTMAVFWTGTLPVMLALGVGLRALAGPLRQHLPTVTAMILLAVGVGTVFGRFHFPAMAPPQSTDTSLIDQVHAISDSEPSCCNDKSHAAN